MFTELNSILNASPDSFTQGEFVLVSDRQSDASFLVNHFLSFYLRARCRVCFLGLVQSFCHYSAVSQRLGVSLTEAKEKGQLIFLEGLNESLSILVPRDNDFTSRAMSFLRDPGVGLRSLYEFVRSSLTGSGGAEEWGPPVLLVDDLSVLLSLGVRTGAVLDFSHYCRATVCSQLQGNMVMLVRCNGDEEEDGDEGSEWLRKGLSLQCSLALHVQGLPTGYCKDIHGQLNKTTRRPLLTSEASWRIKDGSGSQHVYSIDGKPNWICHKLFVEVCWRRRGEGQLAQNKLFQYKVHDKGASFFARGTSSAVL